MMKINDIIIESIMLEETKRDKIWAINEYRKLLEKIEGDIENER